MASGSRVTVGWTVAKAVDSHVGEGAGSVGAAGSAAAVTVGEGLGSTVADEVDSVGVGVGSIGVGAVGASVAGGFNNGPKLRVRLGFTLVRQVAGEYHGFRARP